jgi:hypothetical protein
VSVYNKTPVILQLQTCAVPSIPKGISRRRYPQFLMYAYIAGYSKMLWDINAASSIRPFSVGMSGSSWYLENYVAMHSFGMVQVQFQSQLLVAQTPEFKVF